MEDEQLRENLLAAYGAARSAYGRVSNGKPAGKALMEDRKLQRELAEAANALKEASFAFRQPQPKPKRKGGVGRGLLLLLVGARARARAQRRPALEGARPAVRSRGGVRLQLHDDAGGGGSHAGPTYPPRERDGIRMGERGRAGSHARPGRFRARRRSGSSRRCATAWRVAAPPAPPSTTSRVRRGSRGDCCTTTSGRRSSCSWRRSGATASCASKRSSSSSRGRRQPTTSSALLAENLQETIHQDPDFVTLVFELFTLSRRNEEIAVEYARLVRLMRERLAGMLAAAQARGRAAAARRAGGDRRHPLLARRRLCAADDRRARARLLRDDPRRASRAPARCCRLRTDPRLALL